jgi:hypothetical protein
MSEALEQFGCELKVWVHGRRLLAPAFSHVRPDMAIERSIDLTTIKKLRQIFQGMNFALLQIEWVNHSFPILVRKTRGPDKNIHRVFNSLAGKHGP